MIFNTFISKAWRRIRYCGLKWLQLAFACLAIQPAVAGNTPSFHIAQKPFACHHTDEPVPYFCTPTGQFWGAAIGMSANKAFDGLCKMLPDSVWSVSATSKSTPTPLTKGLNCDQRHLFARSKIWALRASGYPCSQTAYILVVVNNEQIVDYSVLCKELKDMSLLADPRQ